MPAKGKELTLISRHLATASPWDLSQTGRRRWVLSMSTWQAKNHLRKTSPPEPSAPNFTPTAVKTVASQVLYMIAEYHLACATRGSTTTSPILPKAVEQYLPPLVDYTHPGSTRLTDMRVRDQGQQPACRSVAPPNGHVTQLGERGLRVTGTIEAQ